MKKETTIALLGLLAVVLGLCAGALIYKHIVGDKDNTPNAPMTEETGVQEEISLEVPTEGGTATVPTEVSTETVTLVDDPASAETFEALPEFPSTDEALDTMLSLMEMADMVYDEDVSIDGYTWSESVNNIHFADETKYDVVAGTFVRLSKDYGVDTSAFVIDENYVDDNGIGYFNVLSPVAGRLYTYFDGVDCYGCFLTETATTVSVTADEAAESASKLEAITELMKDADAVYVMGIFADEYDWTNSVSHLYDIDHYAHKIVTNVLVTASEVFGPGTEEFEVVSVVNSDNGCNWVDVTSPVRGRVYFYYDKSTDLCYGCFIAD